MRLKKIKLAGFKSFVDPTTILLPGNLIGIVGPNGCGKSNIIDAVRWVMGEISAKHLRGDSMADVIFNGSSQRKPVGHASVELVFDNQDGSLGGQYASYGEIAIRRQVSRDGQSVYFLNGTRCRRKDITDIFLGTGLGPRSYSIIEQGTISRLVEAKPEELRLFLEEAAGISRYKERRRETETRMRHTQENLTRLKDLRDELGKRLQTLQRQAKAAERYKEFKQRERLLRAQLQALRWTALDEEVARRERHIATLETHLEAEVATLRNVEAQEERSRADYIVESEAYNRTQGNAYQVGAEISRLEQAIQHAKETREQQRRDLGEAERAWTEVRAGLDADQALITELDTTLRGHELTLIEAQAQEDRSAYELETAETAMQGWQQQWAEFNAHAATQLQAAEIERARINHLEQYIAQLSERCQRLFGELEGLSPETVEEALSVITDQREEWDRALERLQRDLAEGLLTLDQERQRHQSLVVEINQANAALSAVQGRRASLEALQEEALGARGERARRWLADHDLAERARLAQKLEVETGWEQALEVVLGHALEAVCVEDSDALARSLATLEQGELSLFDTRHTWLVPFDHQRHVPSLLTKVRAPWPLDGLLANVYVAEDLEQALTLRRELAAHESVVTRDGLWLGNGWLYVARHPNEQASVLLREQALKKLAGQLQAHRDQINTLHGALADGAMQLKSLEQEREQNQVRLRDATRRRAEVEAEWSALKERLTQMRARIVRLNEEAAVLQGELGRNQAELAAAQASLEQALVETEDHSAKRERLLLRRDECRSVLDVARERSRLDREARHLSVVKVETLRTQLMSLRDSLEKMQNQLANLGRRREDLNAQLAQSDDPIVRMTGDLEQQLDLRLEAEEGLTAARQRVTAIELGLRELAEQRHHAERQVQSVRDDLDQERLSAQEIRVRRKTLNEQLAETEFKLDVLLQEMPEAANEATWTEELEHVGAQIQRLGAINLAAIDECAEQSERKTYLDAQHADLTEALSTLESAIRKIDRETKDRFQETFDKVNAGLAGMFPRLFGGGNAYLELTGDNILETGVAVMARPPGKRNSTIHLLSGGEKALTAVALVFAIFELNPAPFCMLDEVDAPLDDANVGRYSRMLQDMSSRVQFIYITHNKGTMEVAAQLLGITMHEPGVSRLVAVDVDEAVQMAAVS